MKTIKKRFLSVGLVFFLLTPVLYGCRNVSGNGKELPEFVYLPERTVLTLAAFNLDFSIKSAIVNFNFTNTTYHIHVVDYAELSPDDDWRFGLTRLSAEIISGNIPDILDVSNLPFNQYVAKCLLLDLYPLIDSDMDLSRSDFIEPVLKAAEINGELHKVFPLFSIGTMFGKQERIPSYY